MTLPTGPAVIFLFTDIEGSTRLERALGSAAWAALVARHDGLLGAAIEGRRRRRQDRGRRILRGVRCAWHSAVIAAVAAQRAIADEAWDGGVVAEGPDGAAPWRRPAAGDRDPGEGEDYVGIDVNYAARSPRRPTAGGSSFATRWSPRSRRDSRR